MEKIKLFGDFLSEKNELDRVYRSWKNNNPEIFQSLLESNLSEDSDTEDDWLEDRDLTSGEQAALARDFQVLSRGQLAALYLKALGRYENDSIEDDYSERGMRRRILQDAYVVGIPKIQDFCSVDQATRGLYIGASALADALKLDSLQTVSRTVRKFYNLLSGIGETHDEVLYPKVVNAFNYFRRSNINTIQAIAGEDIADPATSNLHRSKLKRKGLVSEERMKIGEAVHTLFKLLEREMGGGVCKSQRMSIKKIAEERKNTEETVKECYRYYLERRKILNKFNWCSTE